MQQQPAGTPPAATPHFQTYRNNVKVGNGQALGFTRGRGYYARTAPVARTQPGAGQKPHGQLQPLSGAQIANEIAGYVNQLPAPLTDQQIQDRANSLISPIVQAITGKITSAEQAGAGAITGYANELAHNLAGYTDRARNIYSGAEQAQSAANAAEAQATSGQGTQLAGQLAGEIAKLDGPAGLAAATVTPTAATGNGAAAAMLGHGSAFLDKLIAEGTNAQALAAKQPGIAMLQGLADVKSLSLSSQKQLADALAQEQEQVPGLVQSLTAQSDSYRTNRATAANSERRYLTARNDALTAGQAKNQAADAKTQAPNTNWSKTNGYLSDGNGNAILGRDGQPQLLPGYTVGKNGRVQKTATPGSKAANTKGPNATWSKTNGYVSDGSGNAIPDKNGNYRLLPGYTVDGQGRVVKTSTPKSPGKTPQFTPVQVQKYKGTSATIAENAYKGFDTVDKAGTKTTHPPLGYQAAIEEARKEGVPLNIFIPYLNMWFKPGERGRPRTKVDTNPATNPKAQGPPSPYPPKP